MSIIFKKNRDISNFLTSELEGAKKSLKIAVAWLTDPELIKQLVRQKNSKRLEVEVIVYDHELNSQLSVLKDSLRYSSLNENAVMHHKFVIIDEVKVITGSYNWTVMARRHNRENVLQIDDAKIVESYIKEFENLFENSTDQSSIPRIKKITVNSTIEDSELLALEKEFNAEIYDKIAETKKLHLGIDISLAYELVDKHTPVIAAAKLASAGEGRQIQKGLSKLHEAGRLDLSFEESITNLKYGRLFNKAVIEYATNKLKVLGFQNNLR